MADVSPCKDFAAEHRSRTGTELYGSVPEYRGLSLPGIYLRFMLTASQGKLQYHAEQICGIAQSKPEGSCRVNSVQPLYYGALSLPFYPQYSANNCLIPQPDAASTAPRREMQLPGCWRALKKILAGQESTGPTIYTGNGAGGESC